MLGDAAMQFISIMTTVILAFIGYLVTYGNNVRLENRKAQAKFISDQLQNLYGPLFSLSHASRTAWDSFRLRCRPGGGAFFDPESPPSEEELEQWRLWMRAVFMPINLRMEKAIIDNAHLIEGASMPKSFQDLLAHVEVYKAILEKWSAGDVSEHTAYLNFPEALHGHVTRTFEALKQRQMALIGHGPQTP